MTGLPGYVLTWLATYLLHSTVLLAIAYAAARSGLVRRPASLDFMWRVALLGGVVTAAGIMIGAARPDARFAASRGATFDPGSLLSTDPDPASFLPSDFEPLLDAVPGPHRLESMRVRARLVDAGPECRAALDPAGLPGPGDLRRIDVACPAGAGAGADWGGWEGWLVLLWLGGAGLGLVRFHGRARGLKLLRTSLAEPSSRSVRALKEVARGSGVGTVRLAASAQVGAPCAVGDRTIVLPDRCDRELDEDELRAVLAHELAHVARRDVMWLGTARAVAALLWLQPLNRIALRGIVDSAEDICDDWALLRTGHRLGLARSIARVAEWALPQARGGMAVAMAGRDARSLAARVQRILSDRDVGRTTPRWMRMAGVAVLLVPICALPPISGPAPAQFSVVVAEAGVSVMNGLPPGGAGGLDGSAVRRVRILVGESAGTAHVARAAWVGETMDVGSVARGSGGS